jgi:hypothetical protein
MLYPFLSKLLGSVTHELIILLKSGVAVERLLFCQKAGIWEIENVCQTEIVACRASYCKVFSTIFQQVSFTTATGDYTQNPSRAPKQAPKPLGISESW